MTNYPEFFGTIESGYPYVPYAGDLPGDSLYTDTPNSYYDPILGQRALETQLEALISMERHGFDGAFITEQHNGPINLLPNPMLGAAYLAARTNRMKIVVSGPLLNAYQSPIRLAEEIGIIDTMSKGRLVVGLPMGLGQQYHSLGMNPATARERHREGHDLLVKALTEPGPFTWRGKYFNQNYVNVWPRPAHDIEFIMPSGGSIETLELAAKRRYTYQTVLNGKGAMAKTLRKYRDLCRAEGYEPDPKQSSFVIDIHVAETDEIARREVEDSALWSYQNYFEAPEHDNFPPGYTSSRSIRGIRSAGYGSDTKSMTYDNLLDYEWLLAGSPQTVTDKLGAMIEATEAGRVIVAFSFGIKQRWLLEKSMGLFAEEVLPHFRPSGLPLSAEAPTYGFDTGLEFSAKRRRDVPPPTIVRDGQLIDVYKAQAGMADAAIRAWPAATNN